MLKQLRRNLSEDVIEEMCMRLLHLGMSREEIRASVDEWAARMTAGNNTEEEVK